MGRLPVRARLHFLAVVSCAAFLLWDANPFAAPPATPMLALCAVFCVGSALADVYMIELSPDTKVSVSAALDFALMLLAGPALAVWTVAASVAFAAWWHVRAAWPWYNIIFHAASSVIAIGVAGIAYWQTAGDAPLLSTGFSVVALLLAGATYFFLSVGIVATMVALARNADSMIDFFATFQMAAPQFTGLLALGAAAAMVYNSSPVAATLLLFPLAGIYVSLRSALARRAETRRAVEKPAAEASG